MATNQIQTQTDRQHHILDATNRIAGRLASEIAILLMGKQKVNYQPNLDQGDFVMVENVAKLKFTGKKIEQKKYYHFSGYPGGIKTTPLSKIFKEQPEEVMRKVVFRMLPKNKLRKEMIKRLSFKKVD